MKESPLSGRGTAAQVASAPSTLPEWTSPRGGLVSAQGDLTDDMT
jgi:hypothetical protein